MGREMLCFLVLFLQILSLVGASSRKLDLPKALPFTRKGTRIGMELMAEGGANKVMKKMGSRPPSCAHKCYGCMPCEAIQVRLQYTNYEPEDWKCKCGPIFYTP